MIRHVFRLVWNRKRSTGLILVEILVCFLVLCGILATGVHLAIQASRPIGFDYANVWAVNITGKQHRARGERLEADRRALADMLRTVQGMPEVEAAALSTNTPYSGSTWDETTWINGKAQGVLWMHVSPALPDVLRMRMLHGRWLEETDSALGYTPVVISRSLARDTFGTEDAVGRDMPDYDREGKQTEPDSDSEIRRIVGVIDDYRRRGLEQETLYAMYVVTDFTADEDFPDEMLIRVRPGTTAMFEEGLVRSLQSIEPDWSYDTTLLERRRRNLLLTFLMPVLLASVVAGFLILMVGLGLVGVLWLGVTRRTAELGLRRAMGATAASVRLQVVGELWALTAIAVLAGTAVFLQLPLFGVHLGAGWPAFLGGVALATVVIYTFVTVCGLHPAWLATRIEPATALQYE